MSRLFRDEVLDARRTPQFGGVAVRGAAAPWSQILLVSALVVATLSAFAVSSFSRTESATGRLVAVGASVRIIPSRPGVIEALAVSEGSHVRAGQPLATVRVAQTNQDRLDPAAADVAALERQRALTLEQVSLAKSNEVEENARLRASIEGLHSQLTEADEQLKYHTEIAKSLADGVAQIQSVVAKGFMSKLEFNRRRQELLAEQAAIAQMRGQRSALVNEIAQSMQLLAENHNKASTRISDLSVSAAQLTERRIEAESAKGYVISAPVDGAISGLQASKGSSVAPPTALMTIVSNDAPLEGELYLPPRARGFAEVGQRVRLSYDAFPFDRYGTFLGTIASISKTVVTVADMDPGAPLHDAAYIVRVKLPQQSVTAAGAERPLQPGMTLNGVIVLEKRSFLRWLLEPFFAVVNRR